MVMRHLIGSVLMLLTSGCACFSIKPMPDRLSDEAQRQLDYSWEHLVAHEADVERTTLLDVVLVMQAWHQGVDRLYLRSEKHVGNMLVIMETDFDRADPDGDVFAVSFLDPSGDVVRRETFTPAELDDTLCLFMTPEGEVEGETAADREQRLARVAEKQVRWARVQQVFPPPPTAPED